MGSGGKLWKQRNEQMIPNGRDDFGACLSPRPHTVYFMEMQMRSCTEKWAPTGRRNPYASRIVNNRLSQHLSKLEIKTVPREPLGEFAANQTASWGPKARDFHSYLETDKSKSPKQQRAESLTFCVRPDIYLRRMGSPALFYS